MRRLLKAPSLNRKSSFAIGAIGVAGLAVVASGGMAVASYSGFSSQDQILACWQNSQTSNLRLVDHFPCHADETPVSWNKQGVKGATGAAGLAGLAGKDGVAGAAGRDGAPGGTGATGATGAQGPTGLAGAIGKDGADAFTVAVANGFEGNVTQWLASLKGAVGTPGATILTSPSCQQPAVFVLSKISFDNLIGPLVDGSPTLNTSCPPALVGRVGDFYFDTATTTIYGPKTSEGWGPGVLLKGADGTNGSNGTNGNNGANGSDGAPGQSAYDLAKAAAGGDSFPSQAEWLASLKGPKGDAGTPGTTISGTCPAGQYVSGIAAGQVACTVLPTGVPVAPITPGTAPAVSMTFQSDGTNCTPTLHVTHGPPNLAVATNLADAQINYGDTRVLLTILNGLTPDANGNVDMQLPSLAFPLDKVATYQWSASLSWPVPAGSQTGPVAQLLNQTIGTCPAAA